MLVDSVQMSPEITEPLQTVSSDVAAETRAFNARLEDTLRTLPPVTVHGFNAFPIGLARLADAAQFAFLDRLYGPRARSPY